MNNEMRSTCECECAEERKKLLFWIGRWMRMKGVAEVVVAEEVVASQRVERGGVSCVWVEVERMRKSRR